MRLSKTKLYRETVKAALEYHARKPWRELLTNNFFALLLPDEVHPWFGTVMGGGGEEFGLSLTRGPDAALHHTVMLSVNSEGLDMDDLDYLGFTVNSLCEVPPEMRKPLEKARFPARRDTPVPFFLVKEPRRQMRAINQAEAEKILYILKAILKTMENGTFRPTSFGVNCDVLTLNITGELLDPDVVVTGEQYEIPLGSAGECADPNVMPDADDFDGWKAVDLRVSRGIAREAKSMIDDETRALYFGSVDDAMWLLEEHGADGAKASYREWLGCEYRFKSGVSTGVERLLERDLPEAD